MRKDLIKILEMEKKPDKVKIDAVVNDLFYELVDPLKNREKELFPR